MIITPGEPYGSDAGEYRIAALEKQVDGIGVLVGTFTKELLDLKCHYREMSRMPGKYRPQTTVPFQETGAQSPCTAPKEHSQKADNTPVGGYGARKEEPVPDERVMIMQTDGTMKPEVRRGSKNCISAPVGYGASGGYSRYRKRTDAGAGQSRLA